MGDWFGLTVERLWQQRWLAFWAFIGLATTITLAMSLWLYVDAVNTRLLQFRLSDPPYAFRFRYLGSWNGNITQADVDSATNAVTEGFTQNMGLPVAQATTYIRGGSWGIKRGSETMGSFGLGTLSGTTDQMTITAGEWPPETDSQSDEIPVLIPEGLLYKMGLQVGDLITAASAGGQPITLRIAALWKPTNPNDPTWIFPPKYFDEVFLLQSSDFWKVLEGQEKAIDECAWQISFDGHNIKTSDIASIQQRIGAGERDVNIRLPGIRMDVSPSDALNAFMADVNALTQQLVIMILPVGGLVLYFVTLVAGLLISRQQAEDVMLRSRGMSRRGVIGIHLKMWAVLILMGLLLAVVISPLVVRLVGQTRSFLQFNDTFSPVLVAVITPQALLAGLLTGILAASSVLVTVWRTSGQSIIGLKQRQAHTAQAWWQRTYLDVLLLIPALYMLYSLSQRGGLVTSAETPFSDPLAFIAPTLLSLGLTLLFLRIWPFVLGVGGRIITFSQNMALLMALRELVRAIGRYRAMAVMMCFTLSLIGFSASMAGTIDRSLKDSVDYRIGADAVLVLATDAETETSSTGEYTVTGYNTPPIADLLKIEGVEQVSPVGRYPAQLVMTGKRLQGVVLGVDRSAIAAVTRSRADYANEQLAELFNRLAGNRNGIVINAQTARDNNLLIGQEIEIQVSALNEWYSLKVPIVGVVDYFPTLDPDTGFFAIMNIDPIFEAVGTPLPYDVWMSLKPGADVGAIQQQVRDSGFPVLWWLDPEQELHTAQNAPARRGVLGFLSIGFIAAIALTLIGALIQIGASFRAQSLQLGSLRAMGMSGYSVSAYLILTQGIAAVSSIVGGTVIGMVTTLLFLPLLDFSGGLPPYLVRVAWGDIAQVYGIFAGTLLIVIWFTTIVLSRERLTTVIKMGDT